VSDLVKRLRAGPYDRFDPRKDQELEDADYVEALEADGREATRLLDLWSEIPGAEDFAPYQDTMAFLGKPNSVGWVWAREVREERDFDKEQARQRDLAMQCVCEAEEREQAAHARIEALEAALEFYANPETYHAIAMLGDRPCGEFADDFSEDEWTKESGYDRPMPGKIARAALAPEQGK